ncbi:hypothetical protein ACTM9M_15610 [Oliverpabstia intestinalis]|uniref:hypothetical protein n=2 Tax=Oliverpabstia intestinalis TaxID=2606633 RepID=UPI003F8C6444
MPEAYYCGKNVGNSSAQMAETIVNTGSLSLRLHLAVADEKYFYHYFISPCFAPERPVFQEFPGFVWFALKLQIVANQSKIRQVITTC